MATPTRPFINFFSVCLPRSSHHLWAIGDSWEFFFGGGGLGTLRCMMGWIKLMGGLAILCYVWSIYYDCAELQNRAALVLSLKSRSWSSASCTEAWYQPFHFISIIASSDAQRISCSRIHGRYSCLTSLQPRVCTEQPMKDGLVLVHRTAPSPVVM